MQVSELARHLSVASSCDHDLTKSLLLLTTGDHDIERAQPGMVCSGQAQRGVVSCSAPLT